MVNTIVYKFINEEKNKGVFITEDEFLKMIKVCDNRNKPLFRKLVSDWEYLNDEKFSRSKIGQFDKVYNKI